MINWDYIDIEELEANYNPMTKKSGKIRIIYNWEKFYEEIKDLNSLNKDILFACAIYLPLEYNYLPFENCYFKLPVIFTGVFKHVVHFEKCIFADSVNFISPHFERIVSITNCQFKRHLKISGGIYDFDFSLGIASNLSHESNAYVFINGGNFSNLTIGSAGDTSIQVLEISTARVTGNIYIVHSNTTIENLSLHHTSSNLNVTFESFYVNKLCLEAFTNSARFRIHDIKAWQFNGRPSEFCVYRSNLGKAEFLNVDLRSFNIVNIADSYLTDSIFVNTIWPREITSHDLNGRIIINTFKEPTSEEKKNKEFIKLRKKLLNKYYFKNRETYRQLKYAQSKQGDVVNEQRFHEDEMIAYFQYLSWRKLGTKLIVLLSWRTSNFGQSIINPIAALLAAHCALYMIAICCGAVNINWISWKQDVIYYFFYLMNPIHGYEFPKNASIIIDIAMRIVSSYMIYNFIRASRRFIK